MQSAWESSSLALSGTLARRTRGENAQPPVPTRGCAGGYMRTYTAISSLASAVNWFMRSQPLDRLAFAQAECQVVC
jgi:hypothetical protein